MAPTTALQLQSSASSENWDEDFEFQLQGSEVHPRPAQARAPDARKMSIASSAALEDWDADDGLSPPPALHQYVEPQAENWDDDFEDSRCSPRKNNIVPRPRQDSWDDEIDNGAETEDSAELGFAEKEEDRTVTARSRRAALKRLSSSSPPLVPPTNLNEPYRNFQQPFPPRSPSSSVFSIPTTAHTVQTPDCYYYSSTTHLRPTSVFALLPPSPPIHKERERRRLRKKSRPKPQQGMFELVSLRGSSINTSESRLASSRSAGGPSDDASTNQPSRPLPDPGTSTSTSTTTPAAPSRSIPQTPTKGAALLSRIYGKHKRTKSGSGLLVGQERVPPLPTTSFLLSKKPKPPPPPSTQLPYSLPPLPVTSSQLSLRLPAQTGSKHVHDLPCAFAPPPPPSRSVSGTTQLSNSSSLLLPFSSISSRSSSSARNTTASESLQNTPRPPPAQRKAPTRPSSPLQRLPIDSGSPSPSPNSKPGNLLVPISPSNKNQRQSASLGRATAAGSSSTQDGGSGPNGVAHPRRNSLGDLKIPTRISQAQVGLRRDLDMVREFASNVEQLKELLKTHDALVGEIQQILDARVVQEDQQMSPTIADARQVTKRRARSNTNRSISESQSHKDGRVPPGQTVPNELASSFYVITSKYRVTRECADLLIELGGGSTNEEELLYPPPLPPSVSAPVVDSRYTRAAALGAREGESAKRGRERAVTLAGDEAKLPAPSRAALVSSPGAAAAAAACASPNNSFHSDGSALGSPQSWRSSSGRQDLSQRQLALLREMLGSSRGQDTGADIPEESVPTGSRQRPGMLRVTVNKEWKWGDPKNSTVTLRSEEEESEVADDGNGRVSAERKRRSGKLGMSGLRDMLRALKRSVRVEEAVGKAVPVHVQSTTSLSTESSIGSKLRKARGPSERRRRKGVDSIRSASEGAKGTTTTTTTLLASSGGGASFEGVKSSLRRPSLASIFRIGAKHRVSSKTAGGGGFASRLDLVEDEIRAPSSGTGEDSSSTEGDWHRMDSTSDLDATAKAAAGGGAGAGADGSATVRGGNYGGRRKRGPYFQHDVFSAAGSGGLASSSVRSVSQSQSDGQKPGRGSVRAAGSSGLLGKSASVRSMPPRSAMVLGASRSRSRPRLAMTPENIRPLLENAREVQVRLGDCIAELGGLVDRCRVDSGDF